jgi:hypothetical protein
VGITATTSLAFLFRRAALSALGATRANDGVGLRVPSKDNIDSRFILCEEAWNWAFDALEHHDVLVQVAYDLEVSTMDSWHERGRLRVLGPPPDSTLVRQVQIRSKEVVHVRTPCDAESAQESVYAFVALFSLASRVFHIFHEHIGNRAFTRVRLPMFGPPLKSRREVDLCDSSPLVSCVGLLLGQCRVRYPLAPRLVMTHC